MIRKGAGSCLIVAAMFVFAVALGVTSLVKERTWDPSPVADTTILAPDSVRWLRIISFPLDSSRTLQCAVFQTQSGERGIGEPAALVTLSRDSVRTELAPYGYARCEPRLKGLGFAPSASRPSRPIEWRMQTIPRRQPRTNGTITRQGS